MHDNSHDATESRVAQWINARTGLGSGNDPVGFVLASYDLKIQEMAEMRTKLAALEEILAMTAKVCGRNNCNCPRSDQVKKLVNAYMEKFA
jgi:hypothetical protein